MAFLPVKFRETAPSTDLLSPRTLGSEVIQGTLLGAPGIATSNRCLTSSNNKNLIRIVITSKGIYAPKPQLVGGLAPSDEAHETCTRLKEMDGNPSTPVHLLSPSLTFLSHRPKPTGDRFPATKSTASPVAWTRHRFARPVASCEGDTASALIFASFEAAPPETWRFREEGGTGGSEEGAEVRRKSILNGTSNQPIRRSKPTNSYTTRSHRGSPALMSLRCAQNPWIG